MHYGHMPADKGADRGNEMFSNIKDAQKALRAATASGDTMLAQYLRELISDLKASEL